MVSLKINKFSTAQASACFNLLLRLITVLPLLIVTSACTTIEPRVQSVIVNSSLVNQANNDVQLIRAGVSSPVAPGTNLEIGDKIVTGSNAQAVLMLENGAIEVIVMENTEVHIASIFVKFGEVFARVKKNLSEKFEVKSDYGVAGVEGTEFMVKVRPNGEYRCTVVEGRVAVSSAKAAWSSVLIQSRQEMMVVPSGAPNRRELSRQEYNALVQRVNNVERIYRPNRTQLLVPDVTGLAEPDARRILRNRKFAIGDVRRIISRKARIDEVLSQSPIAGNRLRAKQSVQLTVEAEPTTVPSVTGSSLSAAQRSLRRARLQSGKVTETITGQNKVGNVFKQRPSFGKTVPVDSDVELWVEADSVRVPNLLNVDIVKARQALGRLGLKIGRVTTEMVEKQDDGKVIKQSLSARKLVVPNTTIDLVVAEQGVKVPSLIGRSSAVAKRTLAKYKLRLGGVSKKRVRGKPSSIVEQKPRAGTLVKNNSSVNVVIAEPCKVPFLGNETSISVAVSKIRNAGLVPGSTAKLNPKYPIQNLAPKPGDEVRCGSTVNLIQYRIVQ